MNCAKCRYYKKSDVIFDDDDESGDCEFHDGVTFWFLGCDDWKVKESGD